MEFKRDEVVATLNREATRLKDAGDIDSAITCLKQAADRMRVSDCHQTIETWLRLPLFLQQAGRYDEALVEFRRITDETEDRNRRYYPDGRMYLGGTPQQLRERFAEQEFDVIREKMALAARREEKRKA